MSDYSDRLEEIKSERRFLPHLSQDIAIEGASAYTTDAAVSAASGYMSQDPFELKNEHDIDRRPFKDEYLYFDPFIAYERTIINWLSDCYVQRRSTAPDGSIVVEPPRKVNLVRSGGEKAYQKIIYELRNNRTQIPVIAFRNPGFEYELNRYFPKINRYRDFSPYIQTELSEDGLTSSVAPRPIPVRLNYTFEIWTRYHTEMAQIVYWIQKQFDPFKYFVVFPFIIIFVFFFYKI